MAESGKVGEAQGGAARAQQVDYDVDVEQAADDVQFVEAGQVAVTQTDQQREIGQRRGQQQPAAAPPQAPYQPARRRVPAQGGGREFYLAAVERAYHDRFRLVTVVGQVILG